MNAIIGGGICGLSLAYQFEKRGIPYHLFEASRSLGGLIQTKKEGKYQFETGPNSLLIDTLGLSYLQELGLQDQIIEANPVSKNRFIYKNGQYRSLPNGPATLFFSNFLSWSTKIAVFKEMRKVRKDIEQETIGQFFERRFNKEIVDYVLDPFISGIYTGDPYTLLLEKIFPQLKEYEKNFGSVLKGFMKSGKTQRKKTISFKEGLSALINALVSKLNHVSLNAKIDSIQKVQNGFNLVSEKEIFSADQVIMTIPAFRVAPMLQNFSSHWHDAFEAVNYSPVAVVTSVYKKKNVNHPLNGFGGLIPKVENQNTLGSIWTSSVFPDRCPKDEVMLTTFVGGIRNSEKVEEDESIIQRKVQEELSRHFGIKGKPETQFCTRHNLAIPQYDKNILNCHSVIQEIEKEKIYICSNFVNGVSVFDCINTAQTVFQKLTNNQN